MPRVINLHREPAPEGSRYVGRPDPLGNPYVIGRDGTREEVLRKHRLWVQANPHIQRAIAELRGVDLCCFCAPESCHADLYLAIANGDCPNCRGKGYISGDPEAAPIEDCPMCGGFARRLPEPK